MRTPEYLSYSALTTWEKDPEEFYTKYMAPNRPPRIPQDKPAAVGSCFDAKVKAECHAALYGVGADPKYGFEALFEAQVEPQCRNWARGEGLYVFDCYKHSGMYDRLLSLLQQSIEPPRFEFTVKATIGGVPFLGKPDCRFVLPGPVKVVHDFKVNGYCSNSPKSPTKGYTLCRDGETMAKQNKTHNEAHKLHVPLDRHGFTITADYMEDIEQSWADQLSLYSWALGESIGDESVVLEIHQTVAKPMPERRPQLRFAEYRRRVRKPYQELLLKRIQKAWHHISTDHVLRDLSREDNDNRIRLLDQEAQGLQSDGSTRENFYAEAVRPAYRG